MIGALLGAIGTVGSGLLGAQASNRAADYNYQVDLLNYYQREQERNETKQEARRQRNDSQLGSTDAQGNRTYFKDGVGWVTELTDDNKEFQDLYRREETEQLTNDLQKQRDILNNNVERQGTENVYASGLLDAMGRVQQKEDRSLEGDLNRASMSAINEGFDGALNDSMRSAIRSGASNSGKVAAEIGKQKSKALNDAFLNNKINSRGSGKEEYSREVGNLANLYNMFASRASANPGIGYNPRNIDGVAAQQQGAAMGQMGQANGALVNALAKQGGSMQRIEPNYGMANAVGTGSQALAAAFDSFGAQRARQNAYDQYGASASNAGQFKAGNGLW